MKIKGFLLVSSLLIFVFTSCEKAFWEKDYRDKFVGKYQVIEEIIRVGTPECNSIYSLKDTIIIVDYSNTDSEIVVLGREVQLDKNGYYWTPIYEVRFRSDSIFSRIKGGGLGCTTSIIHEGKRISSKP